MLIGTETGQNGIQFYDCKYVKLTGSGDSRYTYGFRVNKTPADNSGIVVTGFSTDFEIEKVEVSGTGFAGILIKQDPTCNPATWQHAFAMHNILVHHNYAHDTGGEGIYIGSSFWNNGMTLTCQGTATTVYPHTIYGLKIYNNVTERTGCEGIQYACAPEAEVYNNVVRFSGVSPFEIYQNNGIQASGNVSGRLCNNIIQNVPGSGIIILGHSGSNLIYNNLITNVGEAGILCDDRPRTPRGNTVIFTNNTIANCGSDGFVLYNDPDVITLTNNVVIQAGTGKLVRHFPGMQVTQEANYYHDWLGNALTTGVIDAAYKPLPGSPLVDKGMVNQYWRINADLQGKSRPQGGGMDIGAYEYQSWGNARSAAPANNGTGWPINMVADRDKADLSGVHSFPSPCINDLSIKIDDDSILEVEIYTVQGVRLLHVTPLVSTRDVTLPTSHIAAGKYLIRVVTANLKVLSGRFIKQ